MNFDPSVLVFPEMPPTEGLILKWDGSSLGNIDEYILAYKKVESDDIVELWSKTIKKSRTGETNETNGFILVKIFKFKDEVPLIADDLKGLFGIMKTCMHKVNYRGQDYIIQKVCNDISLENYLLKINGKHNVPLTFYKEIRRLFVFRWMMCLNCNFENRIEVRIIEGLAIPVSCKELKYSLNGDSNACRIPKTVVKEWFDNKNELVHETIIELLEGKEPNKLKIEIHNIINKHSNKLLFWVNSIFSKIIHLDFT